MSVTVQAHRKGPDYTGAVEVQVRQFSPASMALSAAVTGELVADFRLEPESARQLFGKLGDALREIEANADPS